MLRDEFVFQGMLLCILYGDDKFIRKLVTIR